MATTIFQFEIFSDEIILKVFGYLDINDLFKCSLTSRRLRAISQDKSLPSIWENIHQNSSNFLISELESVLASALPLQENGDLQLHFTTPSPEKLTI